jgi:hypothetical protein
MSDTIKNFICSGKLGDFFLTLYVAQCMWEKDGVKGKIYVSERRERFERPLDRVYTELKETFENIKFPYIDSIAYDTGNDIQDCIDLSGWRTSQLLYKTNWINIFNSFYNLAQPLKESYKWLYSNIKDNTDLILIHHNKLEFTPFLENILRKNKCVFVSNNENEYNNFRGKHLVEFRKTNNLTDMLNVIGSCKFFIGSQSSPQAIAVGLGKPCLVQLLDGIDNIHFKDMVSNLFWFDSYGSKLDGIEKYLIL